MRAFNSFFPLRRWAAVTLLSLFWMTVLPQAAVVAQKPAKTQFQYQLVINPVNYPKTVCVGDQETFKILIQSASVYNPVPLTGLVGVPKATVDANTYDHTTNQMGYAEWSETAKQEGEKPWIITATKDGYGSADPVRFKVNVVKCDWKIGLHYYDDYYDPTYAWRYESNVELPDYVPFTADKDGNLSLVNGGLLKAEFEGTVYYSIPQAFNCYTVPEISSKEYSIQFSGTLNNDRLTIKLFALAATLPDLVDIHCVDDHGAGIYDLPKYPTMKRLDLINRSVPSLASLTFNISGGVKKFKLSRSLIWPAPSQYASGVVVVVRDKAK